MPRQYAMTDADFMGFLRDYHTRHGKARTLVLRGYQ